jgi:hypothetical protein
MRSGCAPPEHVLEEASWDMSVVGWAERVACECCDLVIRRVGSWPPGCFGALQIPALVEQHPEGVRARRRAGRRPRRPPDPHARGAASRGWTRRRDLRARRRAGRRPRRCLVASPQDFRRSGAHETSEIARKHWGLRTLCPRAACVYGAWAGRENCSWVTRGGRQRDVAGCGPPKPRAYGKFSIFPVRPDGIV